MAMRQSRLPGFDGPELEESCPADLPTIDTEVQVAVLPGQFALFTAERELLGQLEADVGDGRFEDAREVRDALAAWEGPSRDTAALGALDRLGAPGFWTRTADECVRDWKQIDRAWHGVAGWHALLRTGVVLRLVRVYRSEAILRADPSLLPLLVNVLATHAAEQDGTAAALVLRDALLVGISAPSGEFDDRAFVDLLAENRAPEWLACLGALRLLWPVPAGEVSEAGLPPPLPGDDRARGLQFWDCLRRAAWSPKDGAIAIEARKRMKLLDGRLHAQFMQHGVRRD
jgi:hypothetical protein